MSGCPFCEQAISEGYHLYASNLFLCLLAIGERCDAGGLLEVRVFQVPIMLINVR